QAACSSRSIMPACRAASPRRSASIMPSSLAWRRMIAMLITTRLERALVLCLGFLFLGTSLHASVVKLVVEHREPFTNQGQPYEKLTGHFYGELDAKHPLNAIITDIEYASKNAKGMVEYSATFTILKPVDMSRATGVLVYQVPNRGRAGIEGGGYFAD